MKRKPLRRILVCVLTILIGSFSLVGLSACGDEPLVVYRRPNQEVGFFGQAPCLEGGMLQIRRGGTRLVPMTDPAGTITPSIFSQLDFNVPVTVSYAGFTTEFILAEILSAQNYGSVITGRGTGGSFITEDMPVTLTWSDEFLGDSVNLDNWEFQHGTGSQGPANPWGNTELQFYRGENSSVSDGYLTINGRQENAIFRWLGGGVSEEIYITRTPLDQIDFAGTPALASQGITRDDVTVLRRRGPLGDYELIDPRTGEPQPWITGSAVGRIFMAEYTSTRMRTNERFYQTFGRFEARMQIPAFPGSWNAFWMMPENNIFPTGGVWPRSGEIDIMENRGSTPAYVGQAVHLSMGNPGQHRMLFNQQAGQRRLRVCPYNRYGFTTYAQYHLVRYTPGMQYTIRYNANYVFGERVEYHFHTYRIDWRPEGMIWYVGYYIAPHQKRWHQVWHLDNWTDPLGGDGGWTGWVAGAANTIEGVPTTGGMPWRPGDTRGHMAFNTGYLLTRRETAPFDHNFHLILNMAIGGMFDRAYVWDIPEGLDVNTRVDWVRAWQFNDLMPANLEIVEPATFATPNRNVGQTPNINGGLLRATLPCGELYYVDMTDPRIVTYPRRFLPTSANTTNVPVQLNFRGRTVTVHQPQVLPAPTVG